MSLDLKIIDLETKIAFQDKAIEELSESLFMFTRKMNALESLCKTLQQKIQTLSQLSGLDVDVHNETPPHY